MNKTSRAAVVFLSSLLIAGCGNGPGSGTSASIPASERAALGECQIMGGEAASATSHVGAVCVGCGVDNASAAADGDPETFAKLTSLAGSEPDIWVRVTREDRTYPGGYPIGAIMRWDRVALTAQHPIISFRTYLGGVLQETLITAEPSGIGLRPLDLGTTHLAQAESSMPFDAIEVVLSSPISVGVNDLEVMEVCSRIGEEDAGNPSNQALFSLPGDIHWTQRTPSRHLSQAMREWYARLETAADSGQAITLPAKYFPGNVIDQYSGSPSTEEPFDVLLQRSDMLATDSFFQINAVDHQGPFVRIYEGTLADNPGAPVHLMIADDFMRGAIRIADAVYLIRQGTSGNLPTALSAAGVANYPEQPPESGEPVGCPEDGIPNNNQDIPGVNGGHRWIPPYFQANAALGLSQPDSELRARIVLDADREAYQRWGRHLPAMMIAMHVEQSLTYRYEVGIRFQIAGIHINTLEGYYPNPLDTVETFDHMEAWWGAYRQQDRDIVHLLTGQPIGTYMASCIGAAGTPYGYFFTATQSEERGESFSGTNVLSHEIGHLFSAHHHYANHLEHSPGTASIMLQGYTPGSGPVFSSLSRGVIRGWGEEYLSGEQ